MQVPSRSLATLASLCVALSWVGIGTGIALGALNTAHANPLQEIEVPVDECHSIRLKGQCKPAPMSAEDNMREVTIKINPTNLKRTLKLPAQALPGTTLDEQGQAIPSCEAHINISYAQRHNRVRVDTEVVNKTCAASTGTFALRIKSSLPTGEPHTDTHNETWTRTDSSNIELHQDYPLPEDSRLMNVSVYSSPANNCACTTP